MAKENSQYLIERAFARTSLGLIHHRIAGTQKEQQKPILMLHASPASSRSLEPLMRSLAKHRLVIAPDTPGCGDSQAHAVAEPEMEDYAHAMFDFLDELSVDEVDIYGTHTGSHIAIEMAIARPERVKSIVLDGVAILSEEQQREYLQQYAPPQKIDQTGSQFHWAWSYMRDQMLFAPHFKKDADHLRLGGDLSAPVLHYLTLELLKNIETYHLTYNAVFKQDVCNRLPLVETPCLVLTDGNGTLDKNAEKVVSFLSNGTLSKIIVSQDKEMADAKSKVIEQFF